MIVSLAIGCIFKHVKGIIREFFMTNLANDMSKTIEREQQTTTYMTSKAFKMPFALQFAIHG